MNPSIQTTSRLRTSLIVVGALLAVCLFASAEDARKRTPFGFSGDATAPAEAPANSPLDRIEFRGVMSIGSETVVLLFDTSKSRSTLLKLNELVDGMKVTDYQAGNDRVRVESGSQAKWIELREAKVVAVAVPPPRQVVPGNPQPPVPQASGAQPAGSGIAQVSDEEVRNRMQRVAEEIRRRRALRRQALQEAQQQPAGGQ